MKLFLKRFCVLFIGFLSLAALISYGGLWSLRHSSFYKPSFLANEIKQESFDYIILGASNGLTTLNTKVIDSILDSSGINLSMDDTGISTQFLMLQHFLAEGKKTKYCILASSPSSFDFKKNILNDNDYRFFMYANRDYVSKYYKQFSDNRANILYYSKWMPMIGMSYYNAELFYPSLASLLKPKRKNRFDDRGNYTYPVLKTKDKKIENFKEMPIAFSNPYVEKISNLCHAHNIELICYVSPIKGKKATIESTEYNVINHSDALTNTKYFYDIIHVNSLGRRQSSINFSNSFNAYILNK